MRQKFHVVLSPSPALDPGDATSGRPATLTHSLPSRVGFRPVHFEVFCPSDNKSVPKHELISLSQHAPTANCGFDFCDATDYIANTTA